MTTWMVELAVVCVLELLAFGALGYVLVRLGRQNHSAGYQPPESSSPGEPLPPRSGTGIVHPRQRVDVSAALEEFEDAMRGRG